MSGEAAAKAYLVETPARTVTTWLVHANNADEAVEIVARGFGDAIDSETTRTGKGSARRHRDADRLAAPPAPVDPEETG